MELQQIKYFLALAEELHFWKTADKINITQSALSRHIQSMEVELGLLLFDRNKRNVKLTPAGSFLREKWAAKLNELEFIHHFAKQIHIVESGTVIIAHPDSISASIMPDLLSRITEDYPSIQIELVQVQYENQQSFLRNYKIDLAITRDINYAPEIHSEKIFSDNLSLVVPELHPFKCIEDLSKETLIDQKFILPIKDEGSSYSNVVGQVFKHYDFLPDVYLHSEFGSAIIALVRKGIGIAILPDSYIYHQSPGLRFIQLPFKSDLYLNWRADDNHPLLANLLKAILKNKVV